MNLEEIKTYLDEDYWERGKTTGKSGYENKTIDEWWDRRLVESLFQTIDLQNKNVLDVGCAMGGIVYFLLKKGVSAWGIDLSEYAIKKGIRVKPSLQHKIYALSAHNLSIFPDNWFDFIYSNQVFEHIPENLIPEMFAELHRIMKSGAVAWAGLVIGEYGKGDDDTDSTHITIKPRQWWHDNIEKAGLKVDYSFDEQYRKHRLPDGYNFFKDYGWHSISFRKI